MGLLDDAIREHLDLMRRHGANEAEIARREAEALGPVLREEVEAQEGGSAATGAAEGEPSLPYDRAAEAGLTGESDLPTFEWYGSSTAEPEVPSFVSPEPVRDVEPELDGMDSRADPEVGSAPTEAFDVLEADRAAEEPSVEAAPAGEESEVSVEPELPKSEGALPEDPSADRSREPPAVPEPLEEAAAPEPHEAAVPVAEDSFRPPPATTDPQPPQAEVSFDAAAGAEADVSLEAPAEAALPEERSIEPTASVEADSEFTEAPPIEDETAVGPSPTEGDLAASPEAESPESPPVLGTEPDSPEAVPLGTEAAWEPSVPPPDREPPEEEATAFHPTGVGAPEPASWGLEELPPEPEPIHPAGGPLAQDPKDLPPEQEPPPLTAGEVVEEPPVGGPDEPPLEAPPEGEVTAFHPTGVGAPEPASWDLEELPPEPEPIHPAGGPLAQDAEDLPPEQEPPPLTAGEVVEEPPVGLGPDEPPLEAPPEPPMDELPIEERPDPPVEEPPIEEPFAAGEEEAWRESGEAPGDMPDARPEPPLGGASPSEDRAPHPAEPLEADAALEPGEEPPLEERPLRGPAPAAELPPPEPLDASPGEPLDPSAGPRPPLPGDSEAARGFFDETAEHERRSSEERAPTADLDFED